MKCTRYRMRKEVNYVESEFQSFKRDLKVASYEHSVFIVYSCPISNYTLMHWLLTSQNIVTSPYLKHELYERLCSMIIVYPYDTTYTYFCQESSHLTTQSSMRASNK